MAAREHTIGPADGRLLIKTGRSGLGRRAGHDLVLEATRWSGTVTEGDGEPPAGAVAEVRVEVDGIRVREGTGGVLPLSEQDRTEIVKNLRKVLRADRHPEIVFRSTETGPDRATGQLTIMDRAEPVTLHLEVTDDRARGSAVIRQTAWGIKPYSAMFGALKLADEVRVEFEFGAA
ncbi:YceI family protein [Actinomadura hibisca]|uniref:YceI family protein n=1 Tax=Actinomadura hibisca TaxID=68565 RepID=UPI000830F2D3|nr:YceI family protein [Actinomadura hibisca]